MPWISWQEYPSTHWQSSSHTMRQFPPCTMPPASMQVYASGQSTSLSHACPTALTSSVTSWHAAPVLESPLLLSSAFPYAGEVLLLSLIHI